MSVSRRAHRDANLALIMAGHAAGLSREEIAKRVGIAARTVSWYLVRAGIRSERVRLTKNVVAGADEMVVYETLWRRRPVSGVPCPGVRP